MTIETALARLTAGLAEDEQAAQEVLAFEEQYHKLRSEGMSVTIRYEWVRHTKLSTGGGGSMFFGGAPTPRDVVRGVEAIRKVIARYEQAVHQRAAERDPFTNGETEDGWAADVQVAAYESFIEDLAGIYTEPTEETEKP